MKKKILVVIGTRPNFIKVTQIKKVALNYPQIDIKIVHTGQHFDEKMANVFFEQFGLMPDHFLEIPQASANTQMAEIMLRLEQYITNEFKPDLMMVVGDVNSTFAGAITANKLGIKLAHLESGLRSNDMTMPEEINRLLTDQITDLFFVTETSGINNLVNEGYALESIKFVGNTMIDTLVAYKSDIEKSAILEELNLQKNGFVLMTMHRPATVDSEAGLLKLINLLEEITKKYKVVFPIHPRTLKKLDEFSLKKQFDDNKQIVLTEPLDYFSFQKLISCSKFILTDSGGIQEESTFLQVPCLTLRPNTERPITVTQGTNTLVPFEVKNILELVKSIENNTYKKGTIPEFWDGKTTDRIMEIIDKL